MSQHFLMSAAARSLSIGKVMRMSDQGAENVFARPLRANDVETITCREFTLEGRGRNIPWLCPLSLMEKLLRLLASIPRMAVGRRWFRGQKPRRLNLSSGRVDARLRPRTNCGSLSRPNARQAFVEASGQSCAVRGFIRRP